MDRRRKLIHLNEKLPSTIMRFDEIFSSLRLDQPQRLRALSSLSADVLNYNNSFIQSHSSESISTYIHEKTYRPHLINVYTAGYVNFLFTYNGSNLITLKDRISHNRNIDVIILINASDYSLRQNAGENKRAISFMVRPEVLIEEYMLNIQVLPTHISSALLGNDARPIIMKFPLPPRVRASVDNVYSTDIHGRAFERYVFAKAEELVLETVHMLNNIYSRHGRPSLVSHEERFSQAIEAAAYLYRHNIGQSLSIPEICRKVGLNRNDLNSGFKDIFRQSPAEYGRAQTLEWAKLQLTEGNHTVSSISEAAGYSSVSAFSRAYSSYHGVSPTFHLTMMA